MSERSPIEELAAIYHAASAAGWWTNPNEVKAKAQKLYDAIAAEVRPEVLEEAAAAIEEEAWPHERPERENEELYRLADKVRKLTKGGVS